ncbi:MAG TPA: T9SS type A sorting domain-containing protein, partial [Bacteroidetes bacterium]|nr:T9SS type A sorting domain-containing protein [Bacteroidota bacterium]
PLTPPSIFDFSSGTVSGTAPANSIVEIFSDPEDEGKIYEGNTTADNSGNFQWAGNPSGPYITATATDSAGNTSIFSQPYITTSVAKKVSLQIPDKFDLQQNYPNPFNPATTIHFELRSSGKPAVWVKLCIYNLQGELIRTLVNEKKAPGIYRVDWDGLDGRGRSVAAGTYLYRIIAGEFRAAKKMILLK